MLSSKCESLNHAAQKTMRIETLPQQQLICIVYDPGASHSMDCAKYRTCKKESMQPVQLTPTQTGNPPQQVAAYLKLAPFLAALKV